MAQRVSAGILLYRIRDGEPQVFLVHMGGPFWAAKDEGAWSIPKGEYAADEDPLIAARREFREETGSPVDGDFMPLTPVRQAGGKLVAAWAVEGDIDADDIVSNTYCVESPRGSGRWRTYPEVDRGGWFTLPQAAAKILASQRRLLDEFARLL
jgi:predicted NUDIX family NTP pyrophosphohydrolase